MNPDPLYVEPDEDDPPDQPASRKAVLVALLALTVAVALVFIANRYAGGAS